MGNFYTNYTLRGPSQQAVVKALAGRSAFVSPARNGCVVVFDERSEDQSEDVIATLASSLSQEFRCPVLAVLNHDDDILWYQLYLRGELVDEYNSTPGYFDPLAGPSRVAGGNAQELCSTFGTSNVQEVKGILHKAAFEEGSYVFAFERHNDLVRALNIPSFAVCGGFSYIAAGQLPEGLKEEDLVRVT